MITKAYHDVCTHAVLETRVANTHANTHTHACILVGMGGEKMCEYTDRHSKACEQLHVVEERTEHGQTNKQSAGKTDNRTGA